MKDDNLKYGFPHRMERHPMGNESLNKGISVIIPCYYNWAFVEECLDSVFQ